MTCMLLYFFKRWKMPFETYYVSRLLKSVSSDSDFKQYCAKKILMNGRIWSYKWYISERYKLLLPRMTMKTIWFGSIHQYCCSFQNSIFATCFLTEFGLLDWFSDNHPTKSTKSTSLLITEKKWKTILKSQFYTIDSTAHC